MVLGRSIAGLAFATAIVAPSQAADTAAVPDLSGFWSRTTFGMEPPDSGQGPVQPVNRRRPTAAVSTIRNSMLGMKTARF
jgi:hypothetical protein